MKKQSRHVGEHRPDTPAEPSDDLRIQVESWGPDERAVDSFLCNLFDQPTVQEYLADTDYRLLGFEFVEPSTKTRVPRPPNRYRATVYDYTNNRTVFIEGCFDERDLVVISESARQPLPTGEEFEAAVNLLRQHPDFGEALREGWLQPYPPMPPVVQAEAERPDGRIERTLAVGLLPDDTERFRPEIVGVNMINREIIRYEGRAPGGMNPGSGICGLPYSGQASVRNKPGQVWITVTQAGQVVWKFLAVRPAASSGTNGSGIELKYVDYRGKRVLYQAHVPILNVRYDGDKCGPYRDWQNQEGMIQANGTDVAPGFRLCNSPAKTFFDSGLDTGNYAGVAIYVQGQEVVLVSEMEAGWYRYIMEWRLHTNGTIRPRFIFSAVRNSCVCNRHHHHVYWRFDFDIRTPGSNIIREFNDPPLFGGSNWHAKTYEIKRPRDPARKRKWRVENTSSGEGYEIIPGPDDGQATAQPDWPFPVGDVWFVKYRGSEIDDGVVAVGPPYEAFILNTWTNGEVISNTDVVVWYAAHATHDFPNEPPGHFGHLVGPELRPVNW